MTPLLTKPQVAKALGVSIKTITNLTRSRSIPFVKIGKCVRFNPDKVEQAISRMTVKEISL